ncbi:MAG: PDZ domain-containing protein [Candidatus Nitrohelix vancouverensis]|uniref:PDZ domain-containing protein n=1 Tax=Candidatus Nitrohelix vancouverensis TaxID=2705534 RepID=A0A7T0G359_9BACT|nr:MAG: PDZ domain-containing protein [Candidatus Nitrohelix vancouverensis]
MNNSPVSDSIRIVLISLFIIWTLVFAREAQPEEFAVPNQGSPYIDLHEPPVGSIHHLPTGIRVSQNQLIDALSGSRVIYIGETHDNTEAHRVQLEIIKALAQRGPISVGVEMFRRSSKERLDSWNRGELSEQEFRRQFHEDWGGGYPLYQPIFEYLRERSIPLIGLKSSKDTESRYREGSIGEFPEIDLHDPYHRAYSMSTFGGHSEKVEKPYRMLLLWEEAMAQTVAEFLKNDETGQRKLIVLAGGFHVQYGFGIPKRAFRRVPHAYSIVLPEVIEVPEELKDREMTIEHVSIPLYAADYVWKVDYKILEDNKIRLGVLLKEEDDGLHIKSVMEHSNAHRAGLQEGDILQSIDDQSLPSVPTLATYLQTRSYGDWINLKVLRNGQEVKLQTQLQNPGETPGP